MGQAGKGKMGNIIIVNASHINEQLSLYSEPQEYRKIGDFDGHQMTNY